MSIKNAIFRVDKAADIGTGHVARSSVLAQYLSQEFQTKVTWIATEQTKQHMQEWGYDKFCEKFITVPECREDFQFNAFSDIEKILPDFGDEKPIFVQDGMKMDHRTLGAAREKGIVGTSLIIDERVDPNINLGAPDFLVDVLPHDANRYTTDMLSSETIKLIGPQYQMISPKVRAQSQKRDAYRLKQKVTGEKNVILMNGGMNIAGLLNHLVWGIMVNRGCYDGIHFDVYTLSKAHHYDELSRVIETARETGVNITLHTDKKPNYAEADLYVGAGGTSVFEACAVGGLPSIIIGAGNGQDCMGRAIQLNGAGFYTGIFWKHGQDVKNINQDSLRPVYKGIENILSDDNLRASISAKSYGFCDGNGAKRIADHLIEASQRSLTKKRSILTP